MHIDKLHIIRERIFRRIINAPIDMLFAHSDGNTSLPEEKHDNLHVFEKQSF